MEKLTVVGPHLAVLLVVFGLAVTSPADSPVTGAGSDEYEDDDVFAPVADKENFDAFDWHLCNYLAIQEPGNVLVSPVSIKLALAMLYEGAEGNTARELERTLQLTTRLRTRTRFNDIIMSLLAKNPQYLLHVATRMYVRDDLHLKPRFVKILHSFYNASVQTTDFDQPEKAVQAVNSWVSEATQGRITSMFSDDMISQSTVMLLVNAIFFKGLWRYPFSENDTKDGVFYVTPTNNVTVPFMNMERELYWTESAELDSAILRLPYMGEKYSMFIVLPNKRDGLNRFLTIISPAMLKTQLFHMTKELVDVRLPKFSFDFTSELGDALQGLGLRDLFDFAAAELPGVARDSNLYVSNIIQKAGLEVNEQGTTAFASTGMELKNKFGGDIFFHADHPFMFFIQDETTGTVIFVGKLINPTAEHMSLRMPPHQPSVTHTDNGEGGPESRFGNEGGDPRVPDTTTLYPRRSPEAPVTRPTVNDVTDDSAIGGDTRCERYLWTYIRNQLRRLREMNGQ